MNTNLCKRRGFFIPPQQQHEATYILTLVLVEILFIVMSYKDRVRKAVEKFTIKHSRKSSSIKRKNLKPEKEVQIACVTWMRSLGWDVSIIESKATYDHKSGRYISQSVKAGYSDCSGNTNHGLSIYIEFKAPGRLSTLRFNQREFLLKKIESGCFAVCVDGTSLLKTLWKEFNLAEDKKAYLISKLPEVKTKDRELDLFD